MGIIAAILAIVGGGLLCAGLRGRAIATGRFCRGCGYELAKLDPDDRASRCPECGRRCGPGERVRTTRRKRRRGAMAAGVTMLLFAAAIAAANTNRTAIYPKLSESTLITLDRFGDSGAFEELHARLRAGTLTTTAVRRLAERSLAVSTSDRPWNPRRSEIIAAAILYDLLSREELIRIAEAALLPRIEVRPVIDAEDTTVSCLFVVETNPRLGAPTVSSGFSARANIERHLKPAGLASPCRVIITGDPAWIEQPPPAIMEGKWGWMNRDHWVPVLTEYMQSHQALALPEHTGDTFTITKAFRFELQIDDQTAHTWTRTASATVLRSADPPPYSTPTDRVVAANPVYFDAELDEHGRTAASEVPRIFAHALTAAAIHVPIERDRARAHEGTRDFYAGRLLHIRGPEGESEANAFLFDVSFRIDGTEIPFTTIAQPSSGSIDIEVSRSAEKIMLDYYDRHARFWEAAVDRGSVDLILRPNPDLARLNPRFTRHVGTGVVFRDVPLVLSTPTELPPERRPPSGAPWGWKLHQDRSYPMIRGEPMPEG